VLEVASLSKRFGPVLALDDVTFTVEPGQTVGAAGAASVAEVAISLVLLLAATVFVWRLSARIYEQVLLRRGARIPWREAAALLRHG
jgi:ABC-type Na+ transport system ATPase subunit NatA